MYHYYVILGGMILGIIALAVLSKQQPIQKKQKIDEDESEKLNDISQNQEELQEISKLQCQKDQEESVRKRQIEAIERKNKLFRNLSDGDRKMVEEFFEKKAKQLSTGEVDPTDRRVSKLITFIKFSIYLLFAVIVYLLLTIAFNTSSPTLILENLKHLVKLFLQQLFAKK